MPPFGFILVLDPPQKRGKIKDAALVRGVGRITLYSADGFQNALTVRKC
jgi:hypothetical protein